MSLQKNSLGIAYTLVLIVFGAVINYFTWSRDGEVTTSLLFLLAMAVVLLYLPFFFFVQVGDWQIKEFGFVANGATIIIAILALAVALFMSLASTGTDFQTALIEAVARTGEELFFRGFVYALTLRILAQRNSKRAFVWAILVSSLAFALVHSQAFLPDATDSMLATFFLALFLGLLRHLTGSLLPGTILHLIFNTGDMVAVLLGCVIYGLFVFWSYRRGENKVRRPVALE